MLDALARLAARLRPLKYLALAIGAASLLAASAVIFASADERYLIPSIVGVLWSLSLYAWIDTFRSVPAPAVAGEGMFGRMKRRLTRAWYWLLAGVCAASTVAVCVVSIRLASIWWRKS